MIDLSYRVRTGQSFNLGDEVIIVNSSPASTNLYERALSRGMPYIHCPCAAKSNESFIITKQLQGGFLLKEKKTGRFTVAVTKDLRKVYGDQ